MSFILPVKSTLDKLGHALGQSQSPALEVFDLDDVTRASEVLTGLNSAIVWELSSLAEDPSDPVYDLTFNYGCKAVNSAANYSLLALFAQIESLFEQGTRFDIKDYSGLIEGPVLGYLYICHSSVNPQLYDKTAGFRLLTVYAKAVRT